MQRVFIISQHRMFGHGLENLLQQEGQFEIVGQEKDVEQAISSIKDIQPDVILLDSKPDDTPSNVLSILKVCPNTKLIVMNLQGNDVYVYWSRRRLMQGVADLVDVIRQEPALFIEKDGDSFLTHLSQSVVINKPVGWLYELWANFENLPIFMQSLKSVTKTGHRTSQWEVECGEEISRVYYVQTTRLEKNRRIAWNCLDEEDNQHMTGQILFTALSEAQTQVTISVQGHESVKTDQSHQTLIGSLQSFKTYAEQQH